MRQPVDEAPGWIEISLTELQIAFLVEKYVRERDRFDKMATVVSRQLSAQLRARAIPHVPTFRAKDSESLSAKLTRDREKHDFDSFEREFAPVILDLAGVRIMLYRPQDQVPTCDVVEELFRVQPGERFRRDFLDPAGYQARHRVVALKDDTLESDPLLGNLSGVLCEVQVVTFGDHIFNELEHDILYKTPTGKASQEQSGLLKVLRNHLNTVGATVEQLMEATERQRVANLTTIDSPEDLSDALRSRLGRRVTGDFEKLLRLLVGTLTSLTRARLDSLPLDEADLRNAYSRLAAAGLVRADDVALVIAALWPTFAADFLEIASGWRGRPGQVARVLQALNQADSTGRII